MKRMGINKEEYLDNGNNLWSANVPTSSEILEIDN